MIIGDRAFPFDVPPLAQMLGLTKSASLGDVKKSYKKLSLAYHPDKLRQRGQTLTEEMQDKFRKIKQAYEVLSDPERRRTYDRLGANGLQLKEDPGSFMQDPRKIQELVQKADRRAYCVVLTSAALVLGYLILFPLLLGLRVDGELSISFAAVFAPLWLVYVIILAGLTSAVARGTSSRPEGLDPDEDWEDDDPLLLRQLGLGVFLLFVAAQVFLVAKLDGGFDAGAPWAAVLVPYYLYDLAQVAGEVFSRQAAMAGAEAFEAAAAKKGAEADAEEAKGEAPSPGDLGFEELAEAAEKRREADLAGGQAVYYGFRLVQVLLLGLAVDGALGEPPSWWLVLLPTFAYAASQLSSFAGGCAAARASAAAAEAPPDLEGEATFRKMAAKEFERSAAAERAQFQGASAQGALCGCCCLLVHALLLGFYLDPPQESFSFFWFYFPWGVVVGCPLICLCCLSACELAGCCPSEEDIEAAAAAAADNDNDDIDNAAARAEAGEAAPIDSAALESIILGTIITDTEGTETPAATSSDADVNVGDSVDKQPLLDVAVPDSASKAAAGGNAEPFDFGSGSSPAEDSSEKAEKVAEIAPGPTEDIGDID